MHIKLTYIKSNKLLLTVILLSLQKEKNILSGKVYTICTFRVCNKPNTF